MPKRKQEEAAIAGQERTDAEPRDRAGWYNQHGQKIGTKGGRTRQHLIDRTVELLETHGLREVSVADVARAANTSAGTFYVYFRDVPDVVLAALHCAVQTSPAVEALLAQDWHDANGSVLAAALVDAYTELWDSHRVVFRVRNLAAEEGDVRFRDARQAAAMPVLNGLAVLIARAQAAGRVERDLSAPACAATLLMMLERLAAVGPQSEGEGLTYPQLKAAAARTIAAMLGTRS